MFKPAVPNLYEADHTTWSGGDAAGRRYAQGLGDYTYEEGTPSYKHGFRFGMCDEATAALGLKRRNVYKEAPLATRLRWRVTNKLMATLDKLFLGEEH